MAPRIVAGLFQSEGIAEDARHRLKTEGVPAVDIGRKVLKEIGRPPETMEPELEAGFLGPLLLGNFRETFAPYIRLDVDEQVEMAIDVLKLYTPIEVRVFPGAEGADP